MRLFFFLFLYSSSINAHSISWECIKNFLTREDRKSVLTLLDQSEVVLPKILLSKDRNYIKKSSDLFTILGTTSGFHGQSRVVYRRLYSWHDFRKNFSKKNNKLVGDITQDLRLFPVMMGVKKAYYFGFQIVTHEIGTVPTLEEINAAISHFNSGLSKDDPRYIQNQFYETQTGLIKDSEYVNNFMEGTNYPISKSGRGFFHDISSHAMQGFFLNNEFFDVIKRRIRIWRRLREYLKVKYKTNPSLLEKLESKIIRVFTRDIDHLAMSGMYFLSKNESLQMTQVGQSLLEDKRIGGESRFGKESYEKIIGTKWGMRIRTTVSNGSLDFAYSVRFKGREFFSKVFEKLVGKKSFEDFFREDVLTYKNEYKGLSFNFLEKEEEVVRIQKRKKGKKREQALRENPITAPFYLRMDRLGELMRDF